MTSEPGHERPDREDLDPLDSDGDTLQPRDTPKSAPSLAGQEIAHYRLRSTLGRGGQGTVYLADDLKLRRPVALKVLHHLHSFDSKTRLRFVREAETASKLTHPGICGVYEFGEHEGTPYLAMQYIEGVPLSEKIASAHAASTKSRETLFIDFESTTDNNLSVATETERTPSSSRNRAQLQTSLQVVEAVARALHAAHEVGLIHRDIKPGNIMIREDGSPVILDFGLARDDESELATLTQTGDVLGTPAYMSPEQISPNSRRVDRRSDVYSLGVTLFEILTLSRPFSEPTRNGLYQAILTKDAPDPRRLNSSISRDLQIIIETALEKDPDRRYQTALDLADDLERLRNFKPIVARRSGPATRMLRWCQRNRAAVAMIATVFVSLLGVALWTDHKNRRLDQTNRDLDRKNSALESANRTVDSERQKAVANAEEANRQAARANANLLAANRNLADFRRMADVRLLREAKKGLEDLWPLGSALLPRLEAFEKRYAGLARRLPEHKKALSDLEALAEPYLDEDRRRDHAPAFARLEVLREEEAAAIRNRKAVESKEQVAALSAQQEARAEEKKSLEARILDRRSWKFAGEKGPFLAWKREVLLDLVTQLSIFCDPTDGAMRQVAQRREKSRRLEEQTVVKSRGLWSACAQRIAGNEKYRGLKLKAQEGLIPLGPDPDSTFEEFLHWASHDPEHPVPRRGPDGKLGPMDGRTGIVLVLLPAGRFTMGATRDKEGPNYSPQARAMEGPPHPVSLDAFFLGKHEVTRGQWARSNDGADPSFWKVDTTGGLVQPADYSRHPVDLVSWREIDRCFARAGLSMPTEARWEYGCRAGTDTPWSFGASPDDAGAHANLADKSYSGAFGDTAGPFHANIDDGFPVGAPVGSLKANAFGLHDMHGNFWEWCFDEDGQYDRPHAPGDGAFPVHGSGIRVARSGCFDNDANMIRSAYRESGAETFQARYMSCRAARDIKP